MLFVLICPSGSPRRRLSIDTKLDENIMEEIERNWVRSGDLKEFKLIPVYLSYLHSPLKSHDVNGVCYPRDNIYEINVASGTAASSWIRSDAFTKSSAIV